MRIILQQCIETSILLMRNLSLFPLLNLMENSAESHEVHLYYH